MTSFINTMTVVSTPLNPQSQYPQKNRFPLRDPTAYLIPIPPNPPIYPLPHKMPLVNVVSHIPTAIAMRRPQGAHSDRGTPTRERAATSSDNTLKQPSGAVVYGKQ